MHHRSGFARLAIPIVVAIVTGASGAMPSFSQGVLDEWASVKAPPPPPIARVTLDPKTTALLVLDFATQTCDAARRPRCLAMLPRAKTLLDKARAKNWLIIYSLGGNSTPSDILPQVAMLGSEPIIKGPPDKFIGTDLEKILKDHGIKTVVAIGSAAEGAVLHTVATSVFRGFDAVVPVDGMAAENAYAEQYTVWDMAHAPRLGERVKLSAIAGIE